MNEIVVIPKDFATSRAFTTFLLLPEVVIPIQTSPSLPNARICLAKIFSKPKSFPIAVNMDESVVNAILEIGLLSISNRPTS